MEKSVESFGLISIIMAAYNAEKTIGFAIDSVINQTYQNWELLVVNDCSKDNTENIIKSYTDKDSRVKLISNAENLGVSLTRLEALKNCSGDWIAILDSDDAWMPEKLEKQIELQLDRNADLIFTGVKYIKADGTPLDWEMKVPQQVHYKKLLKQNVITNSSALVKKQLYTNGYAIGDEMHEDFAVWLNVLKAGITACAVNEPLIIYRVSENSKSGNKLKSAVMNWKTYKYIGLNPFASAYYMIWYTVNGVLKYRHLK
ncbi:MAG: glycosyltransferase family 2 protein [Clostridia bacterium]|nr:glycosyltransferase family 2 protein [Clostridia bacterium]